MEIYKEKLATIKANEPRVYEAGRAAGYEAGYKDGSSESDLYNEGYEQGYEDGKKSVVDYLQYASVVGFPNLNGFSASTILNLKNVTTLRELCAVLKEENKNITVEHLTINCEKQITNMLNMLSHPYQYSDNTLKKITFNVDTSKVTSAQSAFAQLRVLKEINGTPLDFSSITNATNTFQYCYALEEVRFAKETIPLKISFSSSENLSDLSIQSIIDGLADLTGQTAQTLTLHSSVYSRLTAEQFAAATSKNWRCQ